MKCISFVLLLSLSFDVFAGSLFTSSYKSLEEIIGNKEIINNRDEIAVLDRKIAIYKKIIINSLGIKNQDLKDALTKEKGASKTISVKQKATAETYAENISKTKIQSLLERELVYVPEKYKNKSVNDTISLIEKDLAEREAEKRIASVSLQYEGKVCTLCKIVFAPEDEGFGDIALNPFGKGTDYKLNILNYSIYFGDEWKIPFQLYLAEKSSDGDVAENNNNTLLDSTSGIAMQFPVAYRYKGTGSGFCRFEIKNGHCIVGWDVTLRYLELEEKIEGSDMTNKKGVFGMSTGLGASLIFPIFEDNNSEEAGHFSLGMNARYYYHNHDDSSVLFGEILDPDGNKIEFKKDFSALTITSEFALNNQFTIKAEYLKPFNNKGYLSDELNISFVLSGL